MVARDPASLAELADRWSVPKSPSPTNSQKDGAEECLSVVAVLTRILDAATPDVDLLNIVSKSRQDGVEFNMAGVSKKDRTTVSTCKLMALFPLTPGLVDFNTQSRQH